MADVIVALPSGATEGQIQSSLSTLPDGGTLILPADEIISISAGLVMNVQGRSITFDLNGSTLQQAGDVAVLYARAGYGPAQSAALSHDSSGQVTVTTSGAGPVAAVGDWIKLYSDSLLPNDHAAPTRLGQAMQVTSVNGNTLGLEGELVDADAYVDNIRLSKYLSGGVTIENGTVRGDQTHPTWVQSLIQLRGTVGADVNHLTVRDGNSMGINVVGSVDAQLSQIVAMNLTDDTASGRLGYAVHSASSLGTTVIGLYAENVRHATDNNAVGINPGVADPAKYGADIGFTVSDVIAYRASASGFSWHSEGRFSSVSDSVVFDSEGVLAARGIGNRMSDVAGSGNGFGIKFREYGDGDGRDIAVDNVQLRATTDYPYTSIDNTVNNIVSNSTFELIGNEPWSSTGITAIGSVIRMIAAEAANAPGAIAGTQVDDRLIGGGGADTIEAGGGNDYIWGGAGADQLSGGAGADRFAFFTTSEAGDVITDFRTGDGGDAIDLSVIAIRNGWHGDIFAGGYVSLVQSDADTLVQIDTDGGGNDYVTLATLKNVSAIEVAANISTEIHVTGDPKLGQPAPPITGGLLVGTDADEIMFGSPGADTLMGGGGSDWITGGTGKDLLLGGVGSDIFIFAALDSRPGGGVRDLIGDFEQGVDRIDLSALAIHDISALVFQRVGSGVIVTADLDGGGIGSLDFGLQVSGASTLDSGDFIFA